MNPTGTATISRRHASSATAIVLAVAPLLSVWWVTTQPWGAANVSAASWVLWFFWTPLAPFTFAAVALGDHRDRAKLARLGAGRALALIPWLLLSPHSTARVATAANLVGVAAAAMFLLGAL